VIAILKYNAGNIASVKNALNRLGTISLITDDIQELKNADKVIIPGVGEAASAMDYLRDKGLDELIISLKQPVLGICLGLQLLCRYSEERDTKCMGIFDADVHLFPPLDIIPHMGWNNVSSIKGDLFKGINESDNFYFVHSYYAGISSQTSAVCDYILPFSAALQKDNFYAVQFHPEKSAGAGEQLLKNFLAL